MAPTIAGLTAEEWREPAQRPFTGGGLFAVEAKAPGQGWGRNMSATRIPMRKEGRTFTAGQYIDYPPSGFSYYDDAEAWALSRSAGKHNVWYRVVNRNGVVLSFWHKGFRIDLGQIERSDVVRLATPTKGGVIDKIAGLARDQWVKPARYAYDGDGFGVEALVASKSNKWNEFTAVANVRLQRSSPSFSEGQHINYPTGGFRYLGDAEVWAEARSRTGGATAHYRIVDESGRLWSFWHQGEQVYVDAERVNISIINEWNKGEDVVTEMEPIKVKPETLVEKIRAGIAEKRAKWEEDNAKLVEAEQTTIKMVQEAAEKNPLALAKVIEAKHYLSEFKDAAKFVEWLGKMHPETKLEFTPDPDALKLINVLKVAENETIDVAPTSNIYQYLEKGEDDTESEGSSTTSTSS